jgi:hypothetical protein
MQWITESLRRITGRREPAPAVHKSMVYALCEEFRQSELWEAYHAFRLDPQERNWRRLRRRNVAWQSEQTVEGLLLRLCPMIGNRTPDPTTVGLAMVTVAAAPKRKPRL